MELTGLADRLQSNSLSALAVTLTVAVAAFAVARFVLARWFVRFSERSANRVDDVLVRHLRPGRLAWLAPLLVVYVLARLFPDQKDLVAKLALGLILWLSTLTLLALLSAVNTIYESRPDYTGVSIGGYLDIARLAIVFVAVILSITLVTGKSPVALLTGLGAVAAVLMLVFQDTILALVASIQIAANGLLKEGDWVEVPAYDADGDVVNINLHTIRVRNWDMTYSIIPTSKIMDVAFRNWRGMVESGGRRIERSILLDQLSVTFCTPEMLRRLQRIDLLADWLGERIAALEAHVAAHGQDYDWPLDGPQVTNVEVFREYIVAYLKGRTDIHTEGMPFLVRVLEPTPTGLPLQVYVFTRTTGWEEYEAIQGQIFNHLLAAVRVFDLRVFQEPTGLDFLQLRAGPERPAA
ncbi:MAG: mechanosensitive ion channel family protein [Anaerolineae bacterium]